MTCSATTRSAGAASGRSWSDGSPSGDPPARGAALGDPPPRGDHRGAHGGRHREPVRRRHLRAERVRVLHPAAHRRRRRRRRDGHRLTGGVPPLARAGLGAPPRLDHPAEHTPPIVSRSDYHHCRAQAWPLLLGSIALMIVPLLPFTRPISATVNGARRWITLGPLTLQPSEAARFAVAVWAAMLAAKKGEAIRGFKTGVLPFLLVLGVVAVLVLLEPNLSMAALVAFIGGVVLFTAGARIGHFLLLGAAGLFAGVSLIWAEPYRLQRLRCFLEPCGGGSFQLRQALLGFG